MIEFQNASKWYGQVIGINDISCTIAPGITAILGPNGAGKSTFIKLATGQLRPTTGSVRIFGENPFANPSVFRRLGYAPEIEQLYEEMTGRDFVAMLGAMSGIPSERVMQRADECIEFVGMTQHANRKIGGYSKGMRQRIKIAQGIVHDPQVFILDEPLNGLDPMARREIVQLLHQMAAGGKCIVVSSHILYEVEQMTSDILLIYRGRLLAKGPIHLIRAKIDEHPHRVSIECSESRRLAQALLERPYILSARLDNPVATKLEIETRAPELFYDQFPAVVLEGGFKIDSFQSPDNNLESVFRYLVKE